MEPKLGYTWYTLKQFAEQYEFEYAYVRHHRETGELKVKYLHYDDKGIATPADEEPLTGLSSQYTVVLQEEAELFAKEHREHRHGEAEGGSETDTTEKIENLLETLRSESTPIAIIVVSLRGEGLSWLQIGRKLELGKSGNKNEIDALKMRVRRLYKKGTA